MKEIEGILLIDVEGVYNRILKKHVQHKTSRVTIVEKTDFISVCRQRRRDIHSLMQNRTRLTQYGKQLQNHHGE